MKRKTKLLIHSTIVAWCFSSSLVKAQDWTIHGASSGNRFEQCDAGSLIESFALGDFNASLLTPSAGLHINTNLLGYLPNLPSYPLGDVFITDAPNLATSWRMRRGGSQFGRVYNNNDNDFHIEASRQDFMIDAVGVSTSAALLQRMRITSGTGLQLIASAVVNINNITKTVIERGGGVAPMAHPRAMLNIGSDAPLGPTIGGWRAWMDVGTFAMIHSDNMYTGLKIEPNPGFLADDKYDAVISWGDNDALGNGCCGPDNLRFIYTTTNGLDATLEALPDGAEIARMAPNGMMGIGNFTQPVAGGGSGIQPWRKLEIYDTHLFNEGGDNPQLRLTYTPDAIVTNGIWTDFQTTSIGDLYIHPYGVVSSTDVTVTNRNVGINDATPGNTLEITSSPNTAVSPEPAGLRFTNLTNGVTPITNPDAQKGVLSVDNDGDVIFVFDESSNGIVGCTPSGTVGIIPANVNYITKITGNNEICNSEVFEDNNRNVGIGVAASLSAKLTIERLAATTSTTALKINNTMSTTGANTSRGIDMTVSGTGASDFANGIYGTVSGGYAIGGVSLTVSGGTNFNTGGYFACNAPSGGGLNRGVEVDMDGGSNCYGFIASLNNSTTPSGINVGVHSYVNGYGNSTNTGLKTIVMPLTSSSTTTNTGAGVFVGNNSITAATNYGIQMLTQNADDNFGLHMQVVPTAASTTTDNTGIYCVVGSTSVNCNDVKGIQVYARGGTNTNYGVYSVTTTNCSGTTGTYTTGTCVSSAGYFTGAVYASEGYFVPSDSALKTNITDITNPLAIINLLHPKKYQYNTAQFGHMNLPWGEQYGLLAGDLADTMPQYVRHLTQLEEVDSLGNIIHPKVDYLAINYQPLITLLIAGMQQQQQQIDDLQTQLDNCCGAPRPQSPSQGNDERTGAIEIKLVNPDNAILYTNQPNPYTSSTTICYFIPENTSDVKITFQDATGKALKEVPVNKTGQGSIVVDGRELINGIYTYSLVISGKVVDTKKMVKQ